MPLTTIRSSPFRLFVEQKKPPEKPCCTELTLQKVGVGVITAIATLAITAGICIGAWFISPLVFSLSILLAVLLALGIPALSSMLPLWNYVDDQNPKAFKKTMDDLIYLPLDKILKKHPIERLYKYGVIDEITKDKMQSLEKRLQALKDKFRPVLSQKKKELAEVSYYRHEDFPERPFCDSCRADFKFTLVERDRINERYHATSLASYYQERAVIDQEFAAFRK